MNLSEIKENINYLIDNNQYLEKNGHKGYSICLEGGHGIGKTAIVEEIARDRGMHFVKINLGAFEEVGDLTGFPVKKYQMTNNEGELVTVAEASIEAHLQAGYKLVPGVDPVMDFAVPSWVPTAADGPSILMLDDYSRANPMILQSTMELLDKGELGSWKLPPQAQILLTTNPDNGDYSVSSMDDAQKTRFITFDVDFDVKLLAKHMEEVGVRDEFINFAMLYPEIFGDQGKGGKANNNKNNSHATGRTFMAFARSLETVKDLASVDGQARALDISSGIFAGDDNIVGNTFTTFLHNKLDKLVTPDEIITGKWDDVAKKLEKSIGDPNAKGGGYRADIASTITFRLVNHITHSLSKPGVKAEPFIDAILNIANHPKEILTSDLIHAMVFKLFKSNASRMKKLLTVPKFRDMLL